MAQPGEGTIAKALDVMDHVANFARPVRFSELLNACSLPKATLYRMVQTLSAQGMLQYNEAQQTYTPGLRLVRLAHAAWRQSSLAPLARPFIDELAEKVGETIHLAQMDRGQVLYVDKRNARAPVEMFSQAGKIGPGYCTGVGKAIMAFLPDAARADAIDRQAFFAHTPETLTSADALAQELAEIKAQGIAFDREEHEAGIICIAAPILADHRALGALSITSTTARSSLDALAGLKPDLTNTAARIAEAAMLWQFPEPEKG